MRRKPPTLTERCRKLEADNRQLQERVSELETAVQELFWRLDGGVVEVEEPPKLVGKEIDYGVGDAAPLKHCPCCGVKSDNQWACDSCFGYSVLRSPFEERSLRDWFYDLGVRLRAEGKMPPLKKSSRRKTPAPILPTPW